MGILVLKFKNYITIFVTIITIAVCVLEWGKSFVVEWNYLIILNDRTMKSMTLRLTNKLLSSGSLNKLYGP